MVFILGKRADFLKHIGISHIGKFSLFITNYQQSK